MSNNRNTTKAKDTIIANTIKTMNDVGINFCFKCKRVDYPLTYIEVDDKGQLFYKNNVNEIVKASPYLKNITGLGTVRWLNYLYFINVSGEKIMFKQFMSESHACNFT
tara:strand:+ start:72 stop:395 length:324 start_codon:yes stop_codon:yes gene_type:complete